MQDSTPLAALTQAMRARGFAYVGRQADNWLSFGGRINAAGAEHTAHVAVDPAGLELPSVRVTLPAGAPVVLAHLGADGRVCYAAKGSVVLDVFDIAGQTLACIERAAQVLDLSLRGQMKQDLEDEFFAFWHGDLCLLDVEPGNVSALTVLFASQDDAGGSIAFVSSDPARTRLKLKALRLVEKEVFPGVAFKVRTVAKPKPLQGEWPPATVAALLQWQGLLDPAARRNIERHLLTACTADTPGALCVVESPLMQYAFLVLFEPSSKRRQIGRTPDTRVRLYASKVHSLITIRLDDNYMSQRNTPGRPTLASKRIALVGCGTIGGFLAELLVKAGAGQNGGELLLIDPDILLPQNVGRHHLGLNYALLNKATGLKLDIAAGTPTANVRDLPIRAEEADLSRVDLVINATGEEALGHCLTRRATDAGYFVPTLSVWVEGPGIAVRGLLRDAPGAACTRCTSNAARKPLFPVIHGEMPIELAGHGCESLYVPFPATVSVQAACLAAEMVADWAAGAPTPRLRTRITRAEFVQGSPDADISRLEACPACGT